MKKILALVFICLTFSSCGLQNFEYVKKKLQLGKSREISYKNSAQSFVLSEGEILVPIKVDNNLDTVIFDTGSTMGFTEITTEYDWLVKDSCFEMKAKGHYKKSENLYAELSHIQLENELFKIENETRTRIFVDLPCVNLSYPVLGVYPLRRSILILDFDSNRMFVYKDSTSKSKVSTDGYFLLKSDFFSFGRMISLSLIVDSIEESFLFDTGSPITYMDNKHYKKQKGDYCIDGQLFTDISGVNVAARDNNITYRELSIHDSINPTNNVLYYIEDVNSCVLGMNIISQYNWIIDYDNKEVYCKPIKNQVKEDIKEENIIYAATVKNNKLVVIARNKKYTEFELGSVIKSVDGTLITEENICHYKETLNSADNWDEFEIEIAE